MVTNFHMIARALTNFGAHDCVRFVGLRDRRRVAGLHDDRRMSVGLESALKTSVIDVLSADDSEIKPPGSSGIAAKPVLKTLIRRRPRKDTVRQPEQSR